MRIAIIAHNLRHAGGLSVGRGTIAALRRVADQHDYFMTLPRGVGYESIEFPSRSTVMYHERKPGLRGIASQLALDFVRVRSIVLAQRPDVIWGLGNFGVRRPNCAQAVLCQDAHFAYDPSEQPRAVWSNPPEMRVALWRLRRTLGSTNLVFCQTQVMLDRFRAKYRYTGAMAMFPAAVSRAAPRDEIARPAIYEELADKFVLLALSRYYRHKNLELLVDAFEQSRGLLRDVVVVLTIDPRQGYGADGFLRRIATSPARDHFVNAGLIPGDEIYGHFRAARGLLLSSVLETTCLPYVEAMQFDTPIITGDMDFSREMCGDAALYFDPWNAESVCEAIVRFRNEPKLAEQLVHRGRERVKTYFRTWDEIVAEAVGRLERLAEARKN